MAKESKKRFCIQAVATLLQNANFKGFFTGKIYTGQAKNVCVPGLNCYSCPGAVGACPIGSLQSFLNGLTFKFPYYVLGLLIFFGALFGRLICGFVCPFGWIQELVHLIPFPIKKDRFKADRPLRFVKYGVLLLCVIVLPLCLKLIPFFCKYICPSGTISGLLLAISDSAIASKLGRLFSLKLIILLAILGTSLIIWRPFCKYLCPLGAIYSFFNRFSLYKITLDSEKCTGCKECAKNCKMCVDPSESPNDPECIRCGKCISTCPSGALHSGFKL